MTIGHLSQYFTSVAAKKIAAVEVNRHTSNQHEFNGSEALKRVIGVWETGERKEFEAVYIGMSIDEEATVENSRVTWYNARFGSKTRSAEWRLYFRDNKVMQAAGEGDLLIIAKRPDEKLMIIVAEKGSSFENQLIWLFNLNSPTSDQFQFSPIEFEKDIELNLVAKLVLENLGIEVDFPEQGILEEALAPYENIFPGTIEFSDLARRTIKNVDPIGQPDETLMIWIDQEEKLFRIMERKIVQEKLKSGFFEHDKVNADVDGFISFSLSVLNRRKARAGYALENHLVKLLTLHQIKFEKNGKTENRSKPDFLFPSVCHYHMNSFSPKYLSMLGVKTTCKDRWRQVLSEAQKITQKHLLTLEPGISENQTNEMKSHKLQLVVPAPIHATYSLTQQRWLFKLTDFLMMVKERQTKGGIKFRPKVNLFQGSMKFKE
jgi:hypothetical protein